MAGGGGAWKVAYADFVTAMMALFMVLWISAQDQEILLATSQYFQSPFNSPMDSSSGVMSLTEGGSDSSMGDSQETSMTDMAFLNNIAREFYRQLEIEEGKTDTPYEINVTNDGLRVTVFDRTEQPIFEKASDKFTEWGQFVIQNLAWVMDLYEFRIRIDGHTADTGKSEAGDFSDWELSTDRANATRRALQYYAVPSDRFERVTGFANTVPLPGKPPEDDANRRIEISLVILEPLKRSTL